jgi:hypothetical protein
MQIIFDAKCTAAAYQAMGHSFCFPDLTSMLCPMCEGEFLRRHGYYSRYLVLADFEGRILVRRHICLACGRTVSSLPSFAHPKRTFGISFIIGALDEFYLENKGVVAVAAAISQWTPVCCSRQLLRWFCRRIEANAQMLAMGITEVLSLRAPPWGAGCIKGRVRQILKIVINHVPEAISLDLFNKTSRTYLT